jgi:hypothetical protein
LCSACWSCLFAHNQRRQATCYSCPGDAQSTTQMPAPGPAPVRFIVSGRAAHSEGRNRGSCSGAHRSSAAECRWRVKGATHHRHASAFLLLHLLRRYYLAVRAHSFRAGDGRWNGRPAGVILCDFLCSSKHIICVAMVLHCAARHGGAQQMCISVLRRVMEWQHLPTPALFRA